MNWGVLRGLVCALSMLAAACGDNIKPHSDELVVSPIADLVTTEAGGTATFTVSLSSAPSDAITVDLASNNTEEGSVSPAQLMFTADDFGAKTVTITGVDDFVVDGSKAFTIHVSSSFAEADVSVTNQDDDVAGFVVSPNSGLITTGAGGTATFDVKLLSEPLGAVTIPLASDDTDQGTIDKSSLTFDASNWDQAQTVTITGVDDGVHNGNVAYSIVTGGAASGDMTYLGMNPDDVFVTNLDRDLVSIEITPTNPSIALGSTQQFTATGLFDDNTTLDLTQTVQWASSLTTVATVSNTNGSRGLATSAATGSTQITAAFQGVTGTTTLTVTQAALVSIEVTPTNPSIADGTSQQFTATGTYTDQTTQDITTSVLWTSSDLTVGTISNTNGSRGLAQSVDPGTTTITAALSGISGTTTLTVTAATLVRIDVTPVTPSIANGTTQQFIATGVYSDGTTQPLTATATWDSSTTAVATVSNAPATKGVATAVGTGSTTISATSGGLTGSTLLTVTTATLSSIQVTPTNPSRTKGSTVAFTATGLYTDGTTQNLTTQVAWSSSSPSIATVSNASGSQGVATTIAVGQTTITATLGTTTGSTTLTVTPATLTSITIAPINPSAADGTTVSFTATAFFSDGTSQNVTTQATWTSTNGSIATISNAAGTQGVATGVGPGQTTIAASFGGMSASTTLTITAAVLVSVQVTPTNPTIAKGTNIQFTATAVFSDGTTQNVTASSTWASTSTTVATIGNAPGNRGRATGQNVGTTTISAVFNGISGSTTLTVSAATLQSIQVTPANGSAPKGTTRQFTATGVYSDGTTQNLTTLVTWSSTNQTVATISNAAGSQGLVSALNTGTTTISATFGGVTGSTTLTVTAASLSSIQVTPTNPSVAEGTTVQFVATGIYSDGTQQTITTQVTWTSTVQATATISTTGLATSIDPGTTTITAALSGVTGSTTLTVTPAVLVSIQVTPTTPSIAKGSTLQFTATAVFSDATTQDVTTSATWNSTDIAVATQSNAVGSKGLATSVGTGTTSITAAYGGFTGSTTLTVTAATVVSIQVTPSNATIADGTTRQYTATAVYTDSTTQIVTADATWASTTSTTATISNADGSEGLATAEGPGTTTISATYGGHTGSTGLTVTAATLVSIAVSPITPSIADGTTLQFIALGTYTDGSTQNLTDTATWGTTDATAATISNADGSEGLATAVDPGSTTISATSGGITGSTTLTVTMATLVSIQVDPVTPSIANGTTQPFIATGTYTDGSTQNLTNLATWSSTNINVATVTNSVPKGIATGVAEGESTISATFGGKTGSTVLTVTIATLVSIQVTPTTPSIAKGTTLQFTATGIYSDGSQQTLTSFASWSTLNSAVVSVSGTGLATGVEVGSTTISANYGGKTGSTTISVTAATLVSISIDQTNPSIANGTTFPFTATGIFTDNSSQDVTQLATWTSSVTSVATMSPTTKGLATGTGTGSTTITASLSGRSGTTTLSVTGIVLTSVVVTPVNPTMTTGTTLQFTCTGVYSDNTTQNLTASALWGSSDTSFVSVSNVAGSNGLATAVAIGTANVSCTSGTFTDSSTVTVSGITITGIAVSPANTSRPKGIDVQYTAIATYSNGDVVDITADATWTSSDSNVATVSNTLDFEGIVTTTNVGTTTITASYGGTSGSTSLQVTNATCSAISLTPVTPTIAKGTQIQFIANCTFSDGSTAAVTSATGTTWTSSQTGFATISNQNGFEGIATGVAAGTTTISATYQGVTGSTTLTVTNATLVSIAITPSNPTLTVGQTQQLTATGTFSDNTQQDLTIQVNWSSTNKFVAKVTMARRRRGQVTAVAVGTTTIRATTLGVTGTTTVTVN